MQPSTHLDEELTPKELTDHLAREKDSRKENLIQIRPIEKNGKKSGVEVLVRTSLRSILAEEDWAEAEDTGMGTNSGIMVYEEVLTHLGAELPEELRKYWDESERLQDNTPIRNTLKRWCNEFIKNSFDAQKIKYQKEYLERRLIPDLKVTFNLSVEDDCFKLVIRDNAGGFPKKYIENFNTLPDTLAGCENGNFKTAPSKKFYKKENSAEENLNHGGYNLGMRLNWFAMRGFFEIGLETGDFPEGMIRVGPIATVIRKLLTDPKAAFFIANHNTDNEEGAELTFVCSIKARDYQNAEGAPLVDIFGQLQFPKKDIKVPEEIVQAPSDFQRRFRERHKKNYARITVGQKIYSAEEPRNEDSSETPQVKQEPVPVPVIETKVVTTTETPLKKTYKLLTDLDSNLTPEFAKKYSYLTINTSQTSIPVVKAKGKSPNLESLKKFFSSRGMVSPKNNPFSGLFSPKKKLSTDELSKTATVNRSKSLEPSGK